MKHEQQRTEMDKILGKGDSSVVKGAALDRGNLHSSKLGLQICCGLVFHCQPWHKVWEYIKE